jgi:sugar fermentation stimulation protein A
MDSGVYIAVFRLAQSHEVVVGRLGRCAFAAGIYLYVGSAQRNLSARLARHARKDKPLRWHIDYLSVETEMLGAMIASGPKARECELANYLSRRLAVAVPGFGSSDCRCQGHLFYSRGLKEV